VSFIFLPCHAFIAIDSPFNSKYLATNAISFEKYSTLLLQSTSWGITDDWSDLSSKTTDKDHDLSNINEVSINTENMKAIVMEESMQNQFISETIDSIINHHGDASDPQLYDTVQSMDRNQENEMEREMDEIAMMIRCNKSPDKMLIQEGRALGVLEDEEKFDLQQLIMRRRTTKTMNKNGDDSYDSSNVMVLHDENYETTDFFDKAVSDLFSMYAVKSNDKDELDVLDSKAVAKWLGMCFDETIGKHDRQVLSIISKYGTYGKGYFTKANFYQMYMEALKQSLTESFSGIDKTVQYIWRDFYNHDILSPSHAMHSALEKDMEEQINAIKDLNKNGRSSTSMFMDEDDLEFVDECEILDWGVPSKDSEKELKSSYELVEMASDNKTPKRIRDGSFVFVDEETCIGCTQCAQVAPSSYTMLENGRARAFSQSESPEVNIAVSVCPVNCIHTIAFHELKELEGGRDKGDGHGHHKHMGRMQGITPLHVSGMDSDANHKSSWYHYIKQKCCSSGNCPTRGCFDCPRYSKAGDNPYFKEIHRKGQYVRKLDLASQSWEVQSRRKFANV